MVIGLDIGGTKISGIVFDRKKVVKALTVSTPKNLTDFKRQLRKLVGILVTGKKIASLGIGLPGMADKRGQVVYNPNMKFLVGFNLIKFCRSFGVSKIKIENDANCFALAEARLGRGKDLQNFIGITLGTGIGGGLISRGHLYVGAHGSAGEAGHLLADAKRTYEYYFKKYRDVRNYGAIGSLIGRMIADIINLLDVQAVILGGSVSKSANRFLKTAMVEARKHILNKNIQPKILVSQLKNAGALGAALLLINR